MLVLKRLDDAERDGNTVYAVIVRPNRCRRHAAARPQRSPPRASATAATQPSRRCSVTPTPRRASCTSLPPCVALHHRVAPRQRPAARVERTNPATGSPGASGRGRRRSRRRGVDGIARRSLLLAEATDHLAPSRIAAPRLHIFSGVDAAAVLAELDAGRESRRRPRPPGDRGRRVPNSSPPDHAEHADTSTAATPPGAGVSFRATPIDGELALRLHRRRGGVSRHGRPAPPSASRARDPISANFPLGDIARWIFDADHDPLPADYLWGTAMLSQLHAQLTRGLLGLRPTAAIGYSSGETNALFAFGVWNDMDAMHREILDTGMLERELAVEFDAVARAWGVARVEWAVWNVLAPARRGRARHRRRAPRPPDADQHRSRCRHQRRRRRLRPRGRGARHRNGAGRSATTSPATCPRCAAEFHEPGSGSTPCARHPRRRCALLLERPVRRLRREHRRRAPRRSRRRRRTPSTSRRRSGPPTTTASACSSSTGHRAHAPTSSARSSATDDVARGPPRPARPQHRTDLRRVRRARRGRRRGRPRGAHRPV